MAYIVKDKGKKEEQKFKSIKDLWIETFEEIGKLLKKVFDILMKIIKWFLKTLMKFGEVIWKNMDRQFGDKIG